MPNYIGSRNIVIESRFETDIKAKLEMIFGFQKVVNDWLMVNLLKLYENNSC